MRVCTALCQRPHSNLAPRVHGWVVAHCRVCPSRTVVSRHEGCQSGPWSGANARNSNDGKECYRDAHMRTGLRANTLPQPWLASFAKPRPIIHSHSSAGGAVLLSGPASHSSSSMRMQATLPILRFRSDRCAKLPAFRRWLIDKATQRGASGSATGPVSGTRSRTRDSGVPSSTSNFFLTFFIYFV